MSVVPHNQFKTSVKHHLEKHMISKKLLITTVALTALAALALPAAAGFNSHAEATDENRLDVLVTQFKKDGMQGAVIEFTPVTVPGQRCVVFSYGESGGMQCFPQTGQPRTQN